MQFELDKKKLRTKFDRAAESYDRNAVLQNEVAERLLQRLDYIRRLPQTVIDIGSGTGICTQALAKRYNKADVFGVDLSMAMCQVAKKKNSWRRKSQYCCAEAERLPVANDSIDLIVSNLTLQWCRHKKVLQECYRVLRPGGLLMFTSFGPDTLHELRAAWRQVDDQVHVHEFIDMHHLGDELVQCRFADPVMDMEKITLTYDKVSALLRDLKMIGATNAHLSSNKGLTGRNRFDRFQTAYASMFNDDRISATYEIVYGHAWVPDKKIQVTDDKQAITIPITPIGGQF